MLAIVSLTKGGALLSKRILAFYPQAVCFGKYHDAEGIQDFPGRFTTWLSEEFNQYDQWIFIMATGIVVRTIAPHLKHKSQDPAVVVIDEKGQNVISLLSGHLGGANALTRDLARHLSSNPVITTASDVGGLLAVDELAKQRGLYLFDFEKAKIVTAHLVNKKALGIYATLKLDMSMPKGYEEFCGKSGWRKLEAKLENGEIASFIYIGDEKISSKHTYVQLFPRKLVVGIGCRKKTEASLIEAGILDMVTRAGFSIAGIQSIASAWIKGAEAGIISVSDKWEIPFLTYDRQEIAGVADHFEGSEFVRKTIGVPCVSEPCGFLASQGGKCLVPVIKKDGMTLSLWQIKEEYR